MVSPAALNAFFEESDTHLETVESSLLALEKNPADSNEINELFRAVHSLKGNAGFVGFGEIQKVAHEMESIMEGVRKGKETVDQALKDKLFEMLDKLKNLIETASPDTPEKKEAKPVKQPEVEEEPPKEGPKSVEKEKKKPKKSQRSSVPVKKSYLTFILGKEEYGMDINNVREIILRRHITRVPKAKSFVTGIMNLRGMVIPVIDAKKKLEFGNNQEDISESIIVVEQEGAITGLLVDTVKDIVNLDKNMIISAESALGQGVTEHLEGIGKTETASIMLLDVNTFFNSKEGYF